MKTWYCSWCGVENPTQPCAQCGGEGRRTELTLTQAVEIARRVPRAARVAQGYPRIKGFALHIMARRAERAAARDRVDVIAQIRNGIRARFQSLLDARPDLRRAARRVAGLVPHDVRPCVVVLDRGRSTPEVVGRSYVKYRWHNHGASGIVYRPSTRRVEVPAHWLLRESRILRGARLLLRLSDRLAVTRDDARAIGICDEGIEKWLGIVGHAGAQSLPAREVVRLARATGIGLAREAAMYAARRAVISAHEHRV